MARSAKDARISFACDEATGSVYARHSPGAHYELAVDDYVSEWEYFSARILRVVGGVATAIGSAQDDASTGYVLEIVGSSIKVRRVDDGTVVGSATDSAIAGPGDWYVATGGGLSETGFEILDAGVPSLVASEHHSLSGTSTLTATPGADGYRFYRDGELVSEQPSNTYVIAPSEGSWTARTLAGGEWSAPSAPVAVRVWAPLSDITTAGSKYEFFASDVVREGGLVFGDSRDFSRLHGVGAANVFDTGDGYAYVSPVGSLAWLSSWLSHDKRRDFVVEAEVFFSAGIDMSALGGFDQALICYPSEARYAHAVKPCRALGVDGTLSGGFAYGDGNPDTYALSPQTRGTDWRGEWRRVRYAYSVAGGVATVQGSVFIGGTWRSGSKTLVADIDAIPAPAVALHSWSNPGAGNIYATRNLMIISGEMSTYSVAPSRVSGGQLINSVKVAGQTGWVFQGNSVYALGSVSASVRADTSERVYINDGATDVPCELPRVNVPDGLAPSRMTFAAKHCDWRLLDADDEVIASGYSGVDEGVTVVDLAPHMAERHLRPVLVLKDSTSLWRWFDISWDDPADLPPLPPSDVVAVLRGDRVDVAWVDEAENEDGYLLERAVDGGSWEPLATVTTPSYTDADLPEEWAVLRYRVASFNAIGVSAWVESDPLTTAIDGEAHVVAIAVVSAAGIKAAGHAAQIGARVLVQCGGHKSANGEAHAAAAASVSAQGGTSPVLEAEAHLRAYGIVSASGLKVAGHEAHAVAVAVVAASPGKPPRPPFSARVTSSDDGSARVSGRDGSARIGGW